jgi:hypothetical protein
LLSSKTDNCIGAEGATVIGEALLKNTTLLRLDLGGDYFDYLYIFCYCFPSNRK